MLKGELPPFFKLLCEVVHKGILPRGECRHEVTFHDMGLTNAIDHEELVDLPSLIIRHMTRVIDRVPGFHRLAFENLLTLVFKACKVPLGVSRPLTKKDMIDKTTALECDCLPAAPALPKAVGPKSHIRSGKIDKLFGYYSDLLILNELGTQLI